MKNLRYIFLFIISLLFLSSCGVSDTEIDRYLKSILDQEEERSFVTNRNDNLYERKNEYGSREDLEGTKDIKMNIKDESGRYMPLSDPRHPYHKEFLPLKDKLGWKFYSSYQWIARYDDFRLDIEDFMKRNPSDPLWVGDGGGDGVKVAVTLTNNLYTRK